MRSIIAAAMLTMVSIGVIVGTVWTAGEARAHCPTEEPCKTERQLTVADSASDWKVTANRTLFKIEQGFQYMAGMPY